MTENTDTERNKAQLEDFFRVIRRYVICNDCGHAHTKKTKICEICFGEDLFVQKISVDPTSGDSL